MKICLISNSSGKRGGAEKTFPILAHQLRKKGLDVLVALPSKGDMVNELEKLNIDYFVLPFRMWMHNFSPLWKNIVRSIWNLIMLVPLSIKIRKSRCDIILTNTVTVSVGAFAAKLLRIKHVWYIREFGFEDHGRTFDLGNKFSYWLMNKVNSSYIFNSHSVKVKYQKYLKSKETKTVYEGYITIDQLKNRHDFGKIRPETSGKKCIMVGTIQEGKGHKDAINAISILHQENINVTLDIVGTGLDLTYKRELDSLISKHNLEGSIFFHGHIDNPFNILKNSDFFLMCSKNEAFGIVTIEAMQCGLPVIGADKGGTVELIQHGYNGLIYSQGNPTDLSDKIRYLINNPEASIKMGINGSNHVNNNFTLDRYTDEMYDALLKFSK